VRRKRRSVRADVIRVSLFLALLGLPAACRSGPNIESTGLEACDGYLSSYERCLRRTGIPADQMVARLTAARSSMMHAGGAGEASLRTRCIEATNSMARSCP